MLKPSSSHIYVFIPLLLCFLLIKGVVETTNANDMQRKEKRKSPNGTIAIYSGDSTTLDFTSYLELSNNTVISHILPELSTSLETAPLPFTTRSGSNGINYEKDTLGNEMNETKNNFIEVSQNIPNATDENMLSTSSNLDQLGKQDLFTDSGIIKNITQTQYPLMSLGSSTNRHVVTTDKITVSRLYSSTKEKLPTSTSNQLTMSQRIVNKTNLQNIVMNTTYPYTPLNLTKTAPTRTTSATTTDTHIYVRGHKIYNSKHHKRKKFKSNIKTVSGYPMHHTKHNNLNAERQKRKHTDGSKKAENVFLSSYQNHGHQRSFAQTYAWLIGAAMVVIGSLLILLGGILLCYCGEKLSRHREDRRRREKYGDYERVESVSSLVSSKGPNQDCFDDNLETVSMI